MSAELEALVQSLFVVTHRSGKSDWMISCPFHLNRMGLPEATGSLSFSITKGLWYCHTCGEGGGLRKLLGKLGLTEGDISPEILASLEEQRRPLRSPYWTPKVSIDREYRLPESVLGLFDTRPRVPKVCLDWGFTAETIRLFDFGYDRKYLRITFPLRDYLGNLVGFSGRTLGSSKARYKVYGEVEYEGWNLPARPFNDVDETRESLENGDKGNKSKIIWNYDRVNAALRTTTDAPILVTEGFKACAWLVQLGFPFTVALLGSNMSSAQGALLERLGGTLYLFLDNDTAGEKKHDIGQRLANQGCNVRIPTYPTRQPDTLSVDQVHLAMREAPYIVKEKNETNGPLWKRREAT